MMELLIYAVVTIGLAVWRDYLIDEGSDNFIKNLPLL